MENSGVGLSIVTAIIVPTLFWLFSPKQIKEKIIQKFTGPENLIEIRNCGLIVTGNYALLNDSAHIKKNRIVYWPVTPTKSPNIIHCVFLHYVKYLDSIGLKVNVFVFDKYYFYLKNKKDSAYSEVNQFVETLKKMGLPRRCKIIYESNHLNKIRNFNDYYDISSQITINQIFAINNEKMYIKEADKTKYIRFSKSLFSMLYLSTSSKRYSFTLSGYDEKPIWDTFLNTDLNSRYRLVNLYIPTMNGFDSKNSDVLDEINNITYNTSIDEIVSSITNFLSSTNLSNICEEIEEHSIFYLLYHLYFLKNSSISIHSSDNISKEYSNCSDLAKDLFENKLDIEDISKKIYNVFHK